MAVNEQKSKLIGLYQLKVNIKGGFEPHVSRRVTFDKCIDKEGTILYSASLKSYKLEQVNSNLPPSIFTNY
jgi:hypothetical protein